MTPPRPAAGPNTRLTERHWRTRIAEAVTDRAIADGTEHDQVAVALWEAFVTEVTRRLPGQVHWDPASGTITSVCDPNRVEAVVFGDAWDAVTEPVFFYALAHRVLGRAVRTPAQVAALQRPPGRFVDIEGVRHYHFDPLRYPGPPCCR